MNFVHLRVHSEYSIADSIIKVKALASAVAERDMAALALTDLRNLFGLIKFYKACIERGVKPIVGVDITYEVDPTDGESPDVFRLGLLAMNETGYRNLLKLVSEAYLSGGSRGVLTREQVFARNEGLIALSAGRDGEVGQALLKGHTSQAETTARQWAEVFEDRYYLELSRTGRADDDAQVSAAVGLALAIDLPVVATNDVCFLNEDQFEAH